jgi:hypothetical protein
MRTQGVDGRPKGIHTILRFLRLQRIYVRGPIQRRDGTSVFQVGDLMLTDAQLVELLMGKNGCMSTLAAKSAARRSAQSTREA